MLKDSNITEKKKLDITTVQKYLFLALLVLTPLAIMPFPWDWTERSMSLLILGIASVIVGLELIKLIWHGKVTFLKSTLDGGVFAVLVSMILSTLFSKDLNTSLWGIDGRLGGGLIVFITMLVMCFIARSFISDFKTVKLSIVTFVVSFSVINLLSILSFLGVNIFGFIPIYKDLFQTGLPLMRSSKIHLLVNFVLVLLEWGMILDFTIDRKGKNTTLVIALIALFFSAVNIWIFSINQGIGLLILFVLVMVAIWFFGIRKLKVNKLISRDVIVSLVSILVIIIIPVVLLLIPTLRNIILPKSVNLVAQVSLGADVSWIIAASVFVTSFIRGLLGMGVDTYTISYNLLKPLSQNLVQYNDVNFYYGSSQVFTQFANGGLVWLIAWGLMGFVIVKTLVKDLRRIKIYKEDIEKSWYLLLIDFVIVYLYFASFFAVYNVLIWLVLLVLIALRVVLLEDLNKGTEAKFVIKLWTANLSAESENGKLANRLNIVLTVIVACLFTGILVMFISKTISSMYMLKAESYYIEQNNKYKDTTPTIDEREAFVTSMAYYYSQSVKFDGEDPLANRKAGLMYLENVGIAAERYSSSDSSTDKTELINNVGKWKNYALDYTRKSIDVDPNVYSNWEARVQVYMGLVGMGFNDYTSDALYSLNSAIALNPLNYELYYSEAQVDVVNNDKDSALSALTKVLGINAQHIPSIILAADINKEKGNTSVYESYLKAAKKILENNNQTDTDVYQQVTKELNALSSTDTTTNNN